MATTRKTKPSTKPQPLTCGDSWLALGGDETYAPSDPSAHARNKQLWALNERGFLAFTPEGLAAIEAAIAATEKPEPKPSTRTRKTAVAGGIVKPETADLADVIAQAVAAALAAAGK